MTYRFIGALLCFYSLCVFSQDRASQAPEPLHPISVLDVSRYMGTWYEIAKYPNDFQRKCAGFTSAEYRLLKDETIEVVNRCKLANGENNEAVGEVRQIGTSTSAMLEVRFAPAWLSFLPTVWGDYWIIDLDDAYQLAAISEPSREYLWILSRTPTVDNKFLEALLMRLEAKGFDIKKLEMTKQVN